jgi:hypothetical protein
LEICLLTLILATLKDLQMNLLADNAKHSVATPIWNSIELKNLILFIQIFIEIKDLTPLWRWL